MRIEKKRILLVDDEAVNLEILKSSLQENGYWVKSAGDAEEALDILREEKFDLILLDVGMPGMDGFELCKRLKEDPQTKEIPIIFITGRKDSYSVAEGLELGASDYIGKPISEVELLARVKNHLNLKDLQNNLEELVIERTAELQKEIKQRKRTEKDLETSNIKLQKLTQDTLKLLASVVEIRDPFTAGHQQNVTHLSILIARELKLEKDAFDAVVTAATIHDVGKIRIPIEILSRSRKLMDIEMEIIKTHPVTGYQLLKDIDFPWPIAEIVLQHHERLDGSGYPNGLKGDDISFEAKLLSVADVIEGITYHRPYRAGLGVKNAIKELKKNKGILYDASIVEAALKVITAKDFDF
ncbi:HD domain-containing phosphohydrolase [Candidatus Cloacimonadota bacterium]